MALIKPEQLRSSLYQISGSFSGSFQGDGSNLTGIPRISFNNVTASVDSPTDIFLITSSSQEIFKIDNSGSLSFTSNAITPFLIQNFNQEEIIKIEDKVLILNTQSIELQNPAPNGGMYFTSSSFFVGLD